jgi:prepilin-type N-terminal cleavage/methylation domain-containing protein
MADWRCNRGVTLIEMLVVLGIVAVLAGLVVTLTLRIDNQSKERSLANAFALLGTALREYYEYAGKFPEQPERNPANALVHVELMVKELRSIPDSRQVLDKLNPTLVRSEQGIVDVPELRDPWGTLLDYVHAADYSFPELISAGPDRQFGTADDVSSKGTR